MRELCRFYLSLLVLRNRGRVELFVCLLTDVLHDAFSCTLGYLCFLFLSTSCSNMSCAWCPVQSTHLSLPWVLYFSFKLCLRFTLWSFFPGSFPFGWGGGGVGTRHLQLQLAYLAFILIPDSCCPPPLVKKKGTCARTLQVLS